MKTNFKALRERLLEALNDVGWFSITFAGFVGLPSVFAIYKSAIINLDLSIFLSWAVEGYHDILVAVDHFFAPIRDGALAAIASLFDARIHYAADYGLISSILLIPTMAGLRVAKLSPLKLPYWCWIAFYFFWCNFCAALGSITAYGVEVLGKSLRDGPMASVGNTLELLHDEAVTSGAAGFWFFVSAGVISVFLYPRDDPAPPRWWAKLVFALTNATLFFMVVVIGSEALLLPPIGESLGLDDRTDPSGVIALLMFLSMAIGLLLAGLRSENVATARYGLVVVGGVGLATLIILADQLLQTIAPAVSAS